MAVVAAVGACGGDASTVNASAGDDVRRRTPPTSWPATVIELMDERALAAQADLVGAQWEVWTFIEGDSVRAVEIPAPGRLRLDPDGTYEAFDGCVSFVGTYRLPDGFAEPDPPGRVVGTIDLSAPTLAPEPTTTTTTADPPPPAVPVTGYQGCADYQRRFRLIFGDGTSFILRGQGMNTFGAGGGVSFQAVP